MNATMIATTSRWKAQCKDCGRRGDADEFAYPDAWIASIVERGGTRSNRCPSCRKQHARDAQSMALPYIDLDVIGVVPDRAAPNGPLGALAGPPEDHERVEVRSDLAEYDFGFGDEHVIDLLDALVEKQVAVVVAGTGSGKSTFLPYRLLVPPEGSLRLADRGPIIVTEPRVFATIDVATFVATRLHHADDVGAGCDIGYRVKGKPAFDSACRLLFVTDGSLINWIRDGSLDRFSTIVIDEAHERSSNIDLILTLLRAQLGRYPHLRVIVASATIDADFFVEYFGGETRVKKLAIDAKKSWGYGNPFWPLKPVDLDHHDWREGIAWEGRPLRDITAELAELRIVNSEVPLERWTRQMPDLVADQVLSIVRGTESGDVLAFLPGIKTINYAVEKIEREIGEDIDVYPLLRSTSADIQREAREARPAGSRRRVIVATNIAETSLTLEGVTFVVDSGLINQSKWDVASASMTVPPVPHSQDGIRQRWGRVGRKAPGWVFPLYTEEQYAALSEHTPPQAVNADLEALVLAAKASGIDDVRQLVWPASFRRGDTDDPHRESFERELARASRALELRGAIDELGDVTHLGHELVAFSGSAAEAAAIAGADEMACGVEAAAGLAMLLTAPMLGGVFPFKPRNWDARRREETRLAYNALRAGCSDELELALKIYSGWERATNREAWAVAHALSHETLKKIEKALRDRLDFLSPGRKNPVKQAVRPELASRVRAVLTRAFADFICTRDGDGWRRVHGGDDRMYVPAARTIVPETERLIALRRYPAADGTVRISALIAAEEWPLEAGLGWMNLARETSRRLRGENRSLLDASSDDHFLFEAELPVGSRNRCQIVRDGPCLLAVSVERLAGDEVGLDDSGEDESELLVEEEEADTEADDLIPMLPLEGRVTLDPDQELAFRPVEELEDDAPEEEVAVTATEDEETAAPSEEDNGDLDRSGPVELAVPAPLVVRDGTLEQGIHCLRVLGYEGVGKQRTVIVEPVAEQAPRDRLEELKLASGDEIEVEIVETVTGWGNAYVIGRHRDSDARVFLGPEQLALSRDDWEAAARIPANAMLAVTVITVDVGRGRLAVSRLQQLTHHLAQDPPLQLVIDSRGRRRPFRRGLITDETIRGRAVVVLDHADPESGIAYRFGVRARDNEWSPSPGEAVMVSLVPDDGRRKSFKLADPPQGLIELCQEGRALAWDAKKSSVTPRRLIDSRLRERLLALGANRKEEDVVRWRKWVDALVGESKKRSLYQRVGDIRPAEAETAGQPARVPRSEPQRWSRAELEVIFSERDRWEGQVARILGDDGHAALIDLDLPGEEGRWPARGYLPRTKVGPRGVHQLSDEFAVGDRVTVTVVGTRDGERGDVKITLEMRDYAPKTQSPIPEPPRGARPREASRPRRRPPTFEQASRLFVVGMTIEGTVARVRDDDAFIDIGHSQDGYLHRNRIGPHGVLRTADHISPGQRVVVSIDRVTKHPTADIAKIALSMRNL